jgi:hypothetical protein
MESWSVLILKTLKPCTRISVGSNGRETTPLLNLLEGSTQTRSLMTAMGLTVTKTYMYTYKQRIEHSKQEHTCSEIFLCLEQNSYCE